VVPRTKRYTSELVAVGLVLNNQTESYKSQKIFKALSSAHLSETLELASEKLDNFNDMLEFAKSYDGSLKHGIDQSDSQSNVMTSKKLRSFLESTPRVWQEPGVRRETDKDR
jgi:hypothetical protein